MAGATGPPHQKFQASTVIKSEEMQCGQQNNNNGDDDGDDDEFDMFSSSVSQ
jgi:hypothetical protein